jgi:hypothetical protein
VPGDCGDSAEAGSRVTLTVAHLCQWTVVTAVTELTVVDVASGNCA